MRQEKVASSHEKGFGFWRPTSPGIWRLLLKQHLEISRSCIACILFVIKEQNNRDQGYFDFEEDVTWQRNDLVLTLKRKNSVTLKEGKYTGTTTCA
jgi:hypothetical protein